MSNDDFREFRLIVYQITSGDRADLLIMASALHRRGVDVVDVPLRRTTLGSPRSWTPSCHAKTESGVSSVAAVYQREASRHVRGLVPQNHPVGASVFL